MALLRLLLVLSPLLVAGDPLVTFKVSENENTNTAVGNLKTAREVKGLFEAGTLDGAQFVLFPSELAKRLFKVDKNTGIISTTTPINREAICAQKTVCLVPLHVQVILKEDAAGSKVLRVAVEVEDKNDNSPHFPAPKAELSVAENSPVNTIFHLPQAVDADTPTNGVKQYTMNDSDSAFQLMVDKQPIVDPDGQRVGFSYIPMLKQKRALDRERQDEYRYTVWAKDKDGRQGALAVRVTLLDVNDNAPEWDKSPYTVSMRECTPIGEPLLTLRATDRDAGSFGRVSYHIAASAPSEVTMLFFVQGDKLVVSQHPDYERVRSLVVPIVARDGGKLQTPNTIKVRIQDCNDHRPTIAVRPSDRNPRIREDIRATRLVATLLVEDRDSGENGRTSCSIDARAHFRLKEEPGSGSPQVYSLLTLPSAVYDREATPRFRVTVACSDAGEQPLRATHTLVVEVEDENDNPPRFSKPLIRLSVPENNHVGDLVGSVQAMDPDSGQNGVVSYQLAASEASRPFKIDTHGNLRAMRRFDREERDEYRFTVLARDNGKPPLNASATVVVKVQDLNDNSPRFSSNYQFQVEEAAGMTRLSSVHLGRLNATDPDAGRNGTLRYSLTEFVPDRCHMCFVIGQDGSLSVNGPIDRETTPQYRFKVRAVDQGYPEARTGTAWVLVTVTDVNDNVPVFRFPRNSNNTVWVDGETPVGHQVAQILAEDSDEGKNKEVNYSLSRKNQYFRLETDGRLILQKELPKRGSTRTRHYRLVVLAANPDAKKATSAMVNIRVRWRRPLPLPRPDRGNRARPGLDQGGVDGRREGGHRRGTSRSNSLLLLILTAASVIVFILVVTIFALVYLRKIPCQGASTSKRRRRPPAEEEKTGAAGGRQEELFPIQTRGLDLDKMACDDQMCKFDKTLQKRPPGYCEKGSAPSLLDRQTSGNYAYIPAPTFETLDRRCGSGDSVEAELALTGTGKLSRKCYRPAGAESHAYTELEVRDVLLPDLGKDNTATYQNTLKSGPNQQWALSSGTAQRTPVITSSFV